MAKINKVLSDSNTYGATKRWVLANGASPLTTKGDVYTYSTTNTRLGVGSDGYVLTADSSEATGLKWAASTSANYYLTALSFGTDSKITGSMSGVSNITGNAMTTFTPATTFVAEASFTTGLVVGGNSTAAGYIKINPDTDDTGDFPTTLKVGVNTEAQTYTLPLAYPASSGYALVSTDAGVMSWAANSDANYYTSAAHFGTDGILTGTIAGGGSNWTGDFNAGLTMSNSSSNLPKISMTNTNADNSSPLFDFIKDSASPAASDDLGGIRFYGDDSGGAQHNFARIDAESPVVTAGSEVGSIKFRTTDGGTDNTGVMILSGSNVGIGTTSPGALLHIDSDTTGDVEVLRLENSNASTTSIDSVTQSFRLRRDQDDYSYHAAKLTAVKEQGWTNSSATVDASLTFSTIQNETTSEKMRITSAGNLGIGTTAPNEKLEVAPNTDVNAIIGNAVVGYNFSDYASFSHYDQRANTGGYALLQSDVGLTFLNAASSKSIRFRINNADKMTMDADGKLGIGTTSPEGILHTANNSGVNIFQRSNDSASYGTNFYIRKSRGTVGSESDTQSGDLIGQIGFSPYYGDYDNYAASISAKVTGTLGTDTTPGYLAFSTAAAGANTVTQRMAINESGQVGIGTASPSYALDVYDAGTSHAVRFKNASTNGYVMRLDAGGDNSNIQFQTDHIIASQSLHLMNDNANLYVRTSGYKFGVGTSSPKTSMSLVGALSIEERADHETTTAGWGQIWIKNSTPNKPYFTDDAGTDFDLTAGEANVFSGALSDNYIPIGTASDTIGDFVLGLTENNGIWIGSDPTSVTDTATGSVALGITALDSVTTGDGNTAIGRSAGTAINTGEYNTFVGHKAGEQATTSSYNNFFGNLAGYSGTRGNQNNAFGYYAMSINQGTNNVAMGHNAMQGEAGADNDESVGIGAYALRNISGTADMNTAVGYAAMQGAATGITAAGQYNTAVGNRAMRDLTSGYSNVAMGRDAGYDISSGYQNVALGTQAGYNVTTGHTNTLVGGQAARTLTTALGNTAIGYDSLYKATIGGENVAVGKMAGYNYAGTSATTEGAFSTFLGYAAGYAVTGGVNWGHVIAIGHQPMYNATGANKSMAIGNSALVSGTNALDMIAIGQSAGSYGNATGSVYIGNKAGFRPSGNYNVAIGHNAMSGASAGSDAYNNVAIGREAMLDITSGYGNVAMGYLAGKGVTTGINNVFIGLQAGQYSAGGSSNTIIGYLAGRNTTGNYNTILGYDAGLTQTASNRNTFLGYGAGKDYTQTGDNKNTAVGMYAMTDIQSGSNNTAVGYQALAGVNGSDNDYNVAVGYQTLFAIAGGDNNTAIGYQTGDSITTGQGNTLIGYQAGSAFDTENYAVAVGSEALKDAVGDIYAIAIGYRALANSDATGGQNIAMGQSAGRYFSSSTSDSVVIGGSAGAGSSTTDFGGSSVVAVGGNALQDLVSGSYTIAIGRNAFSNTISGQASIAMGANAGQNALNLQDCIFIGTSAGKGAGGGASAGIKSNYDVAIGYQAGMRFGSGATATYSNVAIGPDALSQAVTGNYNVAIGHGAASGAADVGDYNVAIGHKAGMNNSTANYNTFIGGNAGYANTTQTQNTYIGFQAGYASQGTENTMVGYNAGVNTTAGYNVVIGSAAASDMTTGDYNTIVGTTAGANITGSQQNVLLGAYAGRMLQGSKRLIAIGYEAAYMAPTGYQVAIGHTALHSPTTATENIAIGNAALKGGTSSTSEYNTAVGNYALTAVTDAAKNVAIGYKSGYAITTGDDNIIIGYEAGLASTTASSNIIIGTNALDSNNGNNNVIIGKSAAQGATTMDSSTIVGHQAAGGDVPTGDYNTAIGYQTLYQLGTGAESNTALGHRAGYTHTTGDDSTYIGTNAGSGSTTANSNTVVGKDALRGSQDSSTGGSNAVLGVEAGKVTTGMRNVMVGFRAGYTATSAQQNVYVGYEAGQKFTTGDNNVAIGPKAGPSSTSTDSNKLYIHNDSGTPLIGGDFSAKTLTFTADTVNINSTSSNQPELIIKNTNADDSPSFLKFLKRGEDAADGDEIGQIQFIGQDDHTSPNDVTYGDMYVSSVDVSEGTEDGEMCFRVMSGGTLTGVMSLGYDGNGFGMNLFKSNVSGSGLQQINYPNQANSYFMFGSDLSYSSGSATYKPAGMSTDGNPDPNDSGGDQQLAIFAQDDVSISAGNYGKNGGNDIVLRTTNTAASNPTTRMRVKGDGKIGIGTDNPSALVDIVNTSSNWGLYVDQNNTGNVAMKIEGNYGLSIASEGQYPLNITTNGGGKLRMLDSGYLGLGTDAPTTQLDIQATGTAKANLDMLSLTNKVNAADMDGTETSIKFNQWYYDGSSPASEDSGRITVGTLNDWTTSAGTRDSEMSFDISIDGTMYQMGRFNPDGFIIDEYTRLARNTSTNGLYVTDSGGNPVKVSTASGSNGGFSLDNTTANAIYRDSGVSMWDSTESYRLQGNTTSGYLQLDMNRISLVRAQASAASNVLKIGDDGDYDQFSIVEDSRGSSATNGLLYLRARKNGTHGYATLGIRAVSGASHYAELFMNGISTNEAFRFDTNSKTHALDIAKAGYVSVGGAVDSTNQFTVVGTTHLSGAATVTGVLSATAKSFNIQHPLYKDKRLVHGSLEGPEHGIYIRGTIESKEYGCEIELPEYWEAMCDDYTVQLTPHGPYTVYIKEKHKDKVMIACTSKDYKFDYYVVGSRTDETLEVVQDA